MYVGVYDNDNVDDGNRRKRVVFMIMTTTATSCRSNSVFVRER